MCRLTAYMGENLLLSSLLLEPQYSLYTQSWQPRELSYAKLNADGFGFGWYLPDGMPATYRSQAPIWTDNNLRDLCKTLHAPLWLATVRSATADYLATPLNVQPFRYKRLMFLHNGFIKPFNHEVRNTIISRLTPEILDNIHGLTDSEYLFALLCSFAEDQPGNLSGALGKYAEWCSRNLGKKPAMLNTIVTDGDTICALRFALNAETPTLYHNDGEIRNFAAGSQLISSEPLTDDDWREVPCAHLLTLSRKQKPTLTSLSTGDTVKYP